MVPTFTPLPFDKGGAQLCLCGFATATPQTYNVAFEPGDINRASSSRDDQIIVVTMRAAIQPKSVRLELVVVANLVRPAATGPVGRLERRELDVLELMAQGLANTPIANRLVISERTVEAHISHILTKLDIGERRGRPSSCACCSELPPTALVALAPTGAHRSECLLAFDSALDWESGLVRKSIRAVPCARVGLDAGEDEVDQLRVRQAGTGSHCCVVLSLAE